MIFTEDPKTRDQRRSWRSTKSKLGLWQKAITSINRCIPSRFPKPSYILLSLTTVQYFQDDRTRPDGDPSPQTIKPLCEECVEHVVFRFEVVSDLVALR